MMSSHDGYSREELSLIELEEIEVLYVTNGRSRECIVLLLYCTATM